MLNISFQKRDGNPPEGVLFYWRLEIKSDSPDPILDRFIPELFYDFFYIPKGRVTWDDSQSDQKLPLPTQSLKTIHTRPLTLTLHSPLILLGVRLPLQFAESYWGSEIPANTFLDEGWVDAGVTDLDEFANQVARTIRKRRAQRTPAQMLSASFAESDWLAHYSPRHKRRLYKSVFGISRKELDAILGLHAFLGRSCDFTAQRPRIIEYIDADVFYDQPHFNHLFRKMTGLSPLDYLQSNAVLQDNLMAASYNEITA